MVSFDGNNIYHALDVRLQKHYSNGLNFTVAYTWSKNIVNPLAGQIVGSVIDPIHFARSGYVGGLTGSLAGVGGDGYQNPDNINADRALAVNDMPQMLNLTGAYELPIGAGKAFLNQKGPVNVLLGGWRLMGTFNAESGVPLSISGPCNGLTCRPNLVGNPRAVPGGQNENDWINAAAFTPPFGTNASLSGPILTPRRATGGNLGMPVTGYRGYVRPGSGASILHWESSFTLPKASTLTSAGKCSTP